MLPISPEFLDRCLLDLRQNWLWTAHRRPGVRMLDHFWNIRTFPFAQRKTLRRGLLGRPPGSARARLTLGPLSYPSRRLSLDVGLECRSLFQWSDDKSPGSALNKEAPVGGM